MEHNVGTTIGSSFTSWTTKRSVARHFATWDVRSPTKRSEGVIVSAQVRTFRVFKSPNLKSVVGAGSEGEWLVVGPVQGIPTPVR